ncbi:MAG: bestrophin family ion channel [Gloeomargarita sp. GMQP_bins_120]
MQLQRHHWVDLTFTWRGSVLPNVLPRVVFYGVLAWVVVLVHRYWMPLPPFHLATLAVEVVVGSLLFFRTNTAYDRFWEGRKAWGMLVNSARNLALHLSVMVEEAGPRDRQAKEEAVRWVIAYAITLKNHLRGRSSLEELQGLLSRDRLFQLAQAEHRPLTIAFWLADYLRWQSQQQRLTSYQFIGLERRLSELVDALGICERIRRTPQPLAYSVHLRHILILYCLSFPFRLVSQLGWGVIPATAIAAFVVLGIEEIALEIENPFGDDPNDLPLEQLCQVIQRDLEALLQLASSQQWTVAVPPTPR